MSSNSETRTDVLVAESVVVGNNPVAILSENESPRSVSFTAGDGHDYHVRTQITLSNGTKDHQSEQFTARLIRGDRASGTTLSSSQKEIEVPGMSTRTVDVDTSEFRLPSGDYQVIIERSEQEENWIEHEATRVYTRSSSYTWDITSSGEYRLITHAGDEVIRVDPGDGRVSFPSGVEHSSGVLSADELHTATGDLSIGENPGKVITETATPPDPSSIGDSSSPTAVGFTAGGGIDVLEQVDVTIRNSSGSALSGEVTVRLERRSSSGSSVVATESRSVAVAGNGEVTESFLTDAVGLDSADYRAEVDHSVSSYEVYETEVVTKGATFEWEQNDSTLSLIDDSGRTLARFSVLDSDAPEFPNGLSTPALTYGEGDRRSEPSTADLSDGEVMTYVSNGSGTGAAGDLVYAINDGGTVRTSVIGAAADAT